MEDRRAAAMWTLAVDAVTAEVVATLDEDGVESVLLKGPAVAGWLYEDRAERPYVDSDLLVDPARTERAAGALRRLGFRPRFGPLAHVGMESPPSYPWTRDGFAVDLHMSLPGATADPARAWAALRAGCIRERVGGRDVHVLGHSARLAHVALHAAQHRARRGQPVEDLRRALAQASPEQWAEAAEVATAIGASAAFAAGLDSVHEGRQLLGALGLEARGAAAPGGSPVAAGVERLRAARGARSKVSILLDELLPSREFMVWWSPLARRSRRGLAVAYAWRWVYLLRHAPAAVRSLRKRA